MLVREDYMEFITSQLAIIKSKVELCSSLNLLNINIHMESFMCGLLNIVYSYNLVNLNNAQANYTSIDLGDREKRIAIQVTSNTKSTKILHTIEGFVEKGYDKDFDRLIVLIIGLKKNYQRNFVAKNGFCISKNTDIIDFRDLLSEINGIDTSNLQRIVRYLQQEVSTHTNMFAPAEDKHHDVTELYTSAEPHYIGDRIDNSNTINTYTTSVYTPIEHEWLLSNTGSVPWIDRKMVFVNSNGVRVRANSNILSVPITLPGEQVSIKVQLDPRHFDCISECIWEMVDNQGNNCFPGSSHLFKVIVDSQFGPEFKS